MKLWQALFLFAFLGSYIATSRAASNPTPDYWQCTNRVGGSWTFGRIPSGCDANAFGDDAFVNAQYGALIFADAQTRDPETARYMVEMHPVIREIARYYLNTRKPTASADEHAAWQKAVFAIAHQESFWSHYRQASDNHLKLLRGDSGHGHGLMQLDDRWHYVPIQAGKGWSLAQNLAYALAIYYDGWQAAATASCVSSSTNWRDRSRSAYSQYNGGTTKACRWTNPKDTWAKNDINFAQKYDQATWNTYPEYCINFPQGICLEFDANFLSFG